MTPKKTSRGRKCQLERTRPSSSRQAESVGSTDESSSANKPAMGSVSTAPRMKGTARSFVSSRVVSVARRTASAMHVTKTMTGRATSWRTGACACRSGLAREIAIASSASTVTIDMKRSSSLEANTIPVAARVASASGGATRLPVPSANADASSAMLAATTHISQFRPGCASQSTAVLNPATSAELTQSLPRRARCVIDTLSTCGNEAVVMCYPLVESDGGGQCAEAPLPAAKVGDRPFQIRRGEVRPPRVGEVQLRIRRFPQEEIAEAALAASANEQIDVRADARRVGRRSCDRLTRGIIHREAQMQARPIRGEPLRRVDLAEERCRQAVAAPNDGETHSVLLERRRFRGEVPVKESHERRDLTGWTLPVVGREREQRQRAHAEAWRALDDASDGVGARAMPGGASQAARGRPAAVAIHNDRDVQRSPRGRSTWRHKVDRQKKISVHAARASPG